MAGGEIRAKKFKFGLLKMKTNLRMFSFIYDTLLIHSGLQKKSVHLVKN